MNGLLLGWLILKSLWRFNKTMNWSKNVIICAFTSTWASTWSDLNLCVEGVLVMHPPQGMRIGFIVQPSQGYGPIYGTLQVTLLTIIIICDVPDIFIHHTQLLKRLLWIFVQLWKKFLVKTSKNIGQFFKKLMFLNYLLFSTKPPNRVQMLI